MEVNSKTTTTKTSQDLLSCGRGGGIQEKLLLKPQPGSPTLQTQKVPRSSVLDRLQSFLPQMSAANDKLMEQIEDSPAGRFDIECVEDEAERVIQMDVALVELSSSEEEEEEEEEETSDEEDSSEEEEKREVTEKNLKLPGDRKKKKANIQFL
ncbi:hypothetical protein CRUP_030407 [Coryphaenoides rupestris]|nr:hypothetical protein CRUP_030407 [Coryphaenoides rupestris]